MSLQPEENTKLKGFKHSIEKFKQIQLEVTSGANTPPTGRLEPPTSQRDALSRTITDLGLSQANISRRTIELEVAGKGKKVLPEQLSRYLTGKHDLYSEAIETIIHSLPLDARMHFYGLMLRVFTQERW